MISKTWSRRSVLVCAISTLAGGLAVAQPAEPPAKAPVIALFNAGDKPQWETLTAGTGWRVIAAPDDADANIDKRVQALSLQVEEAVKAGTADPSRVYLAGRGDTAYMVFYAISRVPDRWAAGIALGGSAKMAIDTNRIFTANFGNTPVLWASTGTSDGDLAIQLKDDGMNIEWRTANGLTNREVLEWLASHVRAELLLGSTDQVRRRRAQRCTPDDAGPRGCRLGSRPGRLWLPWKRPRSRSGRGFRARKIQRAAQGRRSPGVARWQANRKR
jgi:predicted esterase